MTRAADFRSEFLRGMRVFVPLAISIAAYGLVWGVLAGQAGLSLSEVALMSGLVFAGASQFVALQLWTPAALPVGAIILAVAIVNLRLMLMSATLRRLFASLPRWRALLAMFFVSDEGWALTIAEVNKGRGTIGFFLGTGVACWLSWFFPTTIGRLIGAAISDPTAYGFDFAFIATFIALLLGMWQGRTSILPWLVAALVAIATAKLVPGHWYVITGGLAGSFAGALAETVRRRDVA
jgi:4-azaleucine resistance transporter AzlC